MVRKSQLINFLINVSAKMGSPDATAAISTAQQFVDKFNDDYEGKHLAFEEQFWGTKMALSGSESQIFSAEILSKTKKEMEDLLSDYSTVEKAEVLKAALPDVAPKDLINCLEIIIRTCKCYATSPHIKEIRESTCSMESKLEMKRNRMETLGYTLDGNFQKASSVELRNIMVTNSDENIRKAAYEGLRSIGPFICKNGENCSIKQDYSRFKDDRPDFFLYFIKYVVQVLSRLSNFVTNWPSHWVLLTITITKSQTQKA
jgi:hypothetical protein